ncbi:hypothetical protein Tco_0496896 [Tanacetum coccineum]
MFIEQSHGEVYGCLKGGSGNSGGKRLAISMVEEAWLSEKEEVGKSSTVAKLLRSVNISSGKIYTNSGKSTLAVGMNMTKSGNALEHFIPNNVVTNFSSNIINFCTNNSNFCIKFLIMLIASLSPGIHLNQSDLHQFDIFLPVWKDPPNHLLMGTQAITDLNLPCASM